MKLARLIPQVGMGLGTLCFITAAQAGIPVWSFAPVADFLPATTVSSTGTATVKYTVRNNSSKAHHLVIKPQTGVSQNGPCVLGHQGSICHLDLTITGSALPASGFSGGPVLCQANPDGTPNPNECYQPSKADSLAVTVTQGAPILSASTANLALSVNDTGTNAALTGNARQITITNNGDAPATGLSISYPAWPSGTSPTTTCGSTLAVNATCTITITPGATATSGANTMACTTGIAPTAGVVTVTANGSQASINVVVLGYGCQYQGGFLYSVDDTTNNGVTGTCSSPPCTGSIGGKVASLVDQAEPYISSGSQSTSIIWSSNGSGSTSSDVSYDIIPLIAETSTSNDSYSNAQSTFNSTYSNTSTYPFPSSSAFTACSGASDGACNTGNIRALYGTYITGYGIGSSPYALSTEPTNTTDYAAGLCQAIINTYSDWYLPAICEMDAVNTNVTCPAGTQSMLGDLSFLIGDPGSTTPNTSCTPPSGTDCLAGYYWSSTELSFIPQYYAWFEYFASGGGSGQYGDVKGFQLGVRCSRALTI